ncbi:MAG: EamA family transporter [Synechococcales cyanobacterium T60_A2020_003]|nr:EamA family transporter [Synechococcales cyanobacterium T60_A2020_003]
MKPTAIAELLLLAALWGASFLFMRIAVPVLGPVWLIELRVLFAGIALLPLLLRASPWHTIRQYWRPLIVIGLINLALPFILLAYTTLYLSAGFTAILNATAPLFGTIVSWIWLKEKLTWIRGIGFGLGFLGVVILVSGQQSATPSITNAIAILTGLCGALMYAIAAPYAKKYLENVPSFITSAVSQFTAALFLLPALPFTIPTHPITTPVILSVLLLAVGSTALAYILYFRLIHSIGSTNALTVSYLIPLFAMLWGGLLLREPITLSMMIGCGLIVAGVAIAYANPPHTKIEDPNR